MEVKKELERLFTYPQRKITLIIEKNFGFGPMRSERKVEAVEVKEEGLVFRKKGGSNLYIMPYKYRGQEIVGIYLGWGRCNIDSLLWEKEIL